MKSILVVIAHPDDEVIWAGNFLILLQQQGWSVYVVCLSGNDPDSDRYNEFHQICTQLNWKGVIVGKPIQRAHAELGNWKNLVEQAFNTLQWETPTLVITHSPYGDEFNHPHHTWCYRNVFKWTRENKYSLSFFSFIKLPFFHKNNLLNIQKSGSVVLCEFSSCRSDLYYYINRLYSIPKYGDLFICPNYFIQVNFELSSKKEIFKTYKSVGVDEHINNYSPFHLAAEGIYFFDKRGVDSVLEIFTRSENVNLFAGYEHICIRFFRKVKRWLLK